ncbi:hypothetical protein K503DRAFT_91861 [Rhizopogon vinicolor AM-OR11-026]|uniref:Uncharacterized protein n=1 Tax=Rhizopogon vinicolor AM-OR11-026 TaxID=1314800 RepID=A0A1B7MFK8_9AGAM|nr:hypothetical protein K503DRAFT_91861 [Rhizopogon vinicolor AM-OR11-026]
MFYPLLGNRQAICSCYTHHRCWSSTASQLCQTDWQNSRGPAYNNHLLATYFPTSNPELFHQLILHHPTQTMHFSFLLIIAALTASMSVSACNGYGIDCLNESECCSGLHCDDFLRHCLGPGATA